MRPHCFTEETFTNFGDDLNRWLWHRLLPRETANPDDGILLCGIGTILNAGLPAARHYIVFTSGAGYGPPTPGFGGPNWTIVCVRGPLTAAALGLHPSTAATDGALLLSTLPEYAPIPPERRSGVVCMPHYDVLDAADWPEICRRAGVEFLSPHLPSEAVLERIRGARLVLADAMHAAIVADTLRVPWIPLATSNRINTFKWLDWALPLGLRYQPIELPSPGLMEDIRNRTLGLYRNRYCLREKTEQAALSDFRMNRRIREHRLFPSYARHMSRFTEGLPRRILAFPAFASALRDDTERRMDQSAEALRRAAGATPRLSDDRIFQARVADLVDRLEQLKALPILRSRA